MNTEIVKVLGVSDEYSSEVSEDEVVLINSYITQDTCPPQTYTNFRTSSSQFRSVVLSDLLKSPRLKVVLSEDQSQIMSIVNLETGVKFPALEFDSVTIEDGVLTVKVEQEVFNFLLSAPETSDNYYSFRIINQILDEVVPVASSEWEIWS